MIEPTELINVGRVESRARYDLPKDMSVGIGRIMTRWSYAEDCVQNLLYEMVGVDDATGRIVLREPRLTDRLTMIADLMSVDDVYLTGELLLEYKAMLKQAGDLSILRDLVAHGTWSYSKEHKAWCLTNTRGQWDSEAKKHGLVGKKRIRPEGLLLSPADLASIAVDIEGLIIKLRSLFVLVGIATHQASLEKTP